MSRPSRINPDTRPVLSLAVTVTAALLAVSFLLSYNGLTGVAPRGIAEAGLAWSVPVTVDGAVLVYTLAVLIQRQRGDSARVSWSALGGFTAVSVAANAFHAWDTSGHDAAGVVGAAIAGLAPVAVLVATHTLADLIIERPATSVPEVVPAPVPAAIPAPRPVVAASRPSRPATVPAPSRPKASPARDALIRTLAAEERSVRAIAEQVGVSKSTVGRVLSRP